VHGTDESNKANGRNLPAEPSTITFAERREYFMDRADIHYRRPGGTHMSEIIVYKTCIGIVNRLYGTTRAAEFSPMNLKVIRAEMIKRDWVRPVPEAFIDAILFGPREAEAHRREKRRAARKTPLGYGNEREPTARETPSAAPVIGAPSPPTAAPSRMAWTPPTARTIALPRKTRPIAPRPPTGTHTSTPTGQRS